MLERQLCQLVHKQSIPIEENFTLYYVYSFIQPLLIGVHDGNACSCYIAFLNSGVQFIIWSYLGFLYEYVCIYKLYSLYCIVPMLSVYCTLCNNSYTYGGSLFDNIYNWRMLLQSFITMLLTFRGCIFHYFRIVYNQSFIRLFDMPTGRYSSCYETANFRIVAVKQLDIEFVHWVN